MDRCNQSLTQLLYVLTINGTVLLSYFIAFSINVIVDQCMILFRLNELKCMLVITVNNYELKM